MHGQGSICKVAPGLMHDGGVVPSLRPANEAQKEPGHPELVQEELRPLPI